MEPLWRVKFTSPNGEEESAEVPAKYSHSAAMHFLDEIGVGGMPSFHQRTGNETLWYAVEKFTGRHLGFVSVYPIPGGK